MDIYNFTDVANRDIIVRDKNNPPLSENEIINKAIKKTLDNLQIEDLLKQYRKKHDEEDCNPLTGHCFVATEVLWELLKEKNINEYLPNYVYHENCGHWFLKHKISGDIIDITAGQFKTPVSYHRKGRRSGMMRLSDVPTKRTIAVLDRIKKKNQQLNLQKINTR